MPLKVKTPFSPTPRSWPYVVLTTAVLPVSTVAARALLPMWNRAGAATSEEARVRNERRLWLGRNSGSKAFMEFSLLRGSGTTRNGFLQRLEIQVANLAAQGFPRYRSVMKREFEVGSRLGVELRPYGQARAIGIAGPREVDPILLDDGRDLLV